MKQTVGLDELEPGQSGVIACLHSVGDMRRRLRDIGLIEKTRIECVGKSPCGDPRAFFIRGAVIAIRREDCRDILIER
ncbi:MAG: ferrous iron transport protein A [Ruminococcaceae bacterium]|nr:ferrous iron transport protein A [Oscillospiraceae bacterium]